MSSHLDRLKTKANLAFSAVGGLSEEIDKLENRLNELVLERETLSQDVIMYTDLIKVLEVDSNV